MAKKKAYRDILYVLLMAVRGIFSCLPMTWTMAFAGWAGRTAFAILPKERKKVLEHLSIGFPAVSEKDLLKVGERCFEHYGHTLAELAMIDKLIPRFDKMITVTGREHFDRARSAGKGVIAVTAHFGNWEILGGALSLLGYPGSVIARRIYYERYDKLLVGIRAKMKLTTIYRDESPRRVLQALKENRVLGVVADQDVETVDGVFVDFFGRKAYTPSAPAKLAARTGAALIPCMIIREGLRHRIVIEPPVQLESTGDDQKDLHANTQKWVSVQERFIREYPHLWVWNHKRWKTKN